MSLNNDLNKFDATKLPDDTISAGLQDKAPLEKVGTPKEMPTTCKTDTKTPTTNPSALEAKQTSGSISGRLGKLFASLPTSDQVKTFFGGVFGKLANAGKALTHLASAAKKNTNENADLQTQTITVLNPLFKKNEPSKVETSPQAPVRPARALLDAVKSGDVATVQKLMSQKNSPEIKKVIERDLPVATSFARNMPSETRGLMLQALGVRELPPAPKKQPLPLPQIESESDEVTVEDLPPPVPERDDDLTEEPMHEIPNDLPPPPPPQAKSFDASAFYEKFSELKDSTAKSEMLRNLSPKEQVALKKELTNRQDTLNVLSKYEMRQGSKDITYTVALMEFAKNKVEIENTLRSFEKEAGKAVFTPASTPTPTPTNSPVSSPKAQSEKTASLENVLGGGFTVVQSSPSPKSRLSQGPDSLSKQEKKELSAKLDELKGVNSQEELRVRLENVEQPEQRKVLLDTAIQELTKLMLAKGTQTEKNTLSKLITNMGLLINPEGEFLTSHEAVAKNLQVLGQIPIGPLTSPKELLAARLLSKMSDAPAGFEATHEQEGSFSSDKLLLTSSDYFSASELFNGMAAVLSANAPSTLQEASTTQKLAVLDFAKRWIDTHENTLDNEALKTALLRGQENADPRVKEVATQLLAMLSEKIASQKPITQTETSGSMNQEVQQSLNAVLTAATDSAQYKESVATWCQDLSRALASFKSGITADDLFVGSKNIDKNYGTANTTAAITRINLLTSQLNDLLVSSANPKEGGSPEKYIKTRAFFLDMAQQFEKSNDLEALLAMQGVIESADSNALNNLYVKTSNSDATRNLDKKEAQYEKTCKPLLDKTKNFKNLRARSEEQGVSLPLVMVMRDLFAIRNNNQFSSSQENTQIADTQVPRTELPNPTRIDLSHDTAQAAISLLSKQQKLGQETLETPLGRALQGISIQPRNENQRYEVIKELKAAAKSPN